MWRLRVLKIDKLESHFRDTELERERERERERSSRKICMYAKWDIWRDIERERGRWGRPKEREKERERKGETDKERERERERENERKGVGAKKEKEPETMIDRKIRRDTEEGWWFGAENGLRLGGGGGIQGERGRRKETHKWKETEKIRSSNSC